MCREVTCLSKLVSLVAGVGAKSENLLVFRGEKKDYEETALIPSIYRDDYILHEEDIYRESQRFNDEVFTTDRTAFDKLSRIQHYSAPTRLIDVSEDLFSAIYFAIAEKGMEKDSVERKNDDAVIYLFEIDRKKVKYYDSDTVSVISNLAKIPLHSSKGHDKSKEQLLVDALKFKFKVEAFIDPEHLISIQFVYPKFISNRVKSQKGAFLLFGLNPEDVSKPIKLMDQKGCLIPSKKLVNHPVKAIHKFILKYDYIDQMKKELEALGIRKPFIYPEIDKVSEYLGVKYK